MNAVAAKAIERWIKVEQSLAEPGLAPFERELREIRQRQAAKAVDAVLPGARAAVALLRIIDPDVARDCSVNGRGAAIIEHLQRDAKRSTSERAARLVGGWAAQMAAVAAGSDVRSRQVIIADAIARDGPVVLMLRSAPAASGVEAGSLLSQALAQPDVGRALHAAIAQVHALQQGRGVRR